MNSGKRQMARGKTQALYKYLPESWIDFSVRGKERQEYIAKVDHWSSEKLSKDNINIKRLVRIVNNAVRAYGRQDSEGKALSGFREDLTPDNCDVLTPKISDDGIGIVANISPLIFYCAECHKIYQFDSEEQYKKNRTCKKCGIKLKQLPYIYFCKCGYATDKHNARCKIHGTKDVYWHGGYDFTCHSCQNKWGMGATCPNCGSFLGPKYPFDLSQFFTYSVSLIDLIDEDLENFISESDSGVYMAIAFWLGKIDKNTLDELVKKKDTENQGAYQAMFEKNFKILLEALNNDENMARKLAKQMADENCGNQYNGIADRIRAKLNGSTGDAQENISRSAEMILEYSKVKILKRHATIDKAIEVAKTLNTNANPETFKDIAKKYGIAHAQACDEIPFVSCSYGFTREKSEYEEGVKLNAFKAEKRGRKNIYAVKMSTEGVLFEFDRKRIIEWLAKNEFIDAEDMPDLSSDEDIKLWFINHIKPKKILPFAELSDVDERETYYVYRLLHSISHLLIRAAGDIGGLGKNSLSEYIFPGVPAILIYCQNVQGFKLGSLFNTFEAYFDKWMNRAHEFAQKCVFDPICIERDKACTGCLFLNEISCQHFNKDLDRTLLIGHVDKETKKRIKGFWEEQ